MEKQLMSSYLNNHTKVSDATEEEIDLKEVFRTLGRYKKSIAIIVFSVFLLSSLYAYFGTSIYQAQLTLQIQEKSGGQSTDDLMAKALGVESANVDNEIAIFQSRFVAQKALEKLNIGTRYYVFNNLKKVELYKDSPFEVDTKALSPRLFDSEFQLTAVDENHFRLTINPSKSEKIAEFLKSMFGTIPEDEKLVRFSQVFSYGMKITHPLFEMIISKKAPMGNEHYSFSVLPNEYMYAMLQSSLMVSAGSEKGTVLYLTYQDNVPQRAQDVLNALADAYTNQSIEVKSESAEKTLSFIDKQLEAINSALQNSASNLKDYKSSHIVVDLKDKATIAAQKMDQLETQLYELDMQQSVLKNLLSYLQNNKEIEGIDVGSATASSSPILSLIEKIQAANSLYASLLADYTDKHPSVIKVAQQIVSLKASLRGTIESSLRGIEQRKATLNDIISKNRMSLEGLPEQEKQLSQLTRSFMVNEKVYEYLLQKRVETAIVESSTVSGVRVIDNAVVDDQPIKPKRALIVLIGLILGLIIGVMQAFLRNYLANTIQSISDIEKHTNLPIYAVLPYFTGRKSLYEDALRVLLTKLEFQTSKPKIITITSSVQGEGRTTTAIEFARVISSSGKKVIVLDLDMRGSKMHEKLNLSNALGMSTLLSKKSTLEGVIQPIDSNLDIIAAGPAYSNTYALIISDRLAAVLEELKTQYDYIILESPPAGVVADALVLMRKSDLNLIVFKAKYSKKDFIKNINRFVEEHQLENVGIVLNALDLKNIRPWINK
ncbi:MAG: polysaccharide biosynthesis tyrosine autokinase [Sulfuricurvum sp.]|jgi:capsular exopolysaccharide synthesis family protein|uniref:GumC family protein n=1 Tax=Sulfuricurvum sp. TaxID=2025608 RepID=UPI0025E80A77|nr:polysaccharide biosynthesis tyrosine autokinase [Sulfuricurvum sp.]MCI4407316.1 polysaccharide biosynthesis tyrosine autokinase [Sulfuricurvum sp.]